MKRIFFCVSAVYFLIAVTAGFPNTFTYNVVERVSMFDLGFPADERSVTALTVSGNTVYGVTSGLRCHVFRFDPKTKKAAILASIDAPNTVMKGLAVSGDTLYFGTMLTKEQVWWLDRKRGGTRELLDANLIPLDDSWHTGRLYRVVGIGGGVPKIEELGVPVPGQGIHTLAMDAKRGLLYGLTYPTGRFFIYNTKTSKTDTVAFGTTVSEVSNHMVTYVEVTKDLTDFTPGEVEFNNKLVAKAMHIRSDGTLFTSGWDGRIMRYDPRISVPREQFAAVGAIPSVPGRRYWNRIDAIVEHGGKLFIGTSDGYIARYDPATGGIVNYGKPVRAIEVMGMAFSPLDGCLYGMSGGGIEGMSRFWRLDPASGTFEVDYTPFPVLLHRRPAGALVCTADGAIVVTEATRVGDLWVLTPGKPRDWPESGTVPLAPLKAPDLASETWALFKGHKKLEVEVFPVPSSMHGGGGYTAIAADDSGHVYVGGDWYGKFAPLMRLDPATNDWRLLFRSDELTHQFGRGQGIPGKIHTKLRVGTDGKIYGAMKQGYEFHYDIRSDVGESPEGERGGQFSGHFFSWDPKKGRAEDLGPSWPQEGIMGFQADTERGYLYGISESAMYFLVYDLKTGRVWNAGPVGGTAQARYTALDPDTGRVYNRGEVTPSGRYFMTVWDPGEFRLREIEVAPAEGFRYDHSYAICCGPRGSHTLYGAADGRLFAMDLRPGPDGKLPVRPLCTIGVDGEPKQGTVYAVETGPDGRVYWVNNYFFPRPAPIPIFAWDPSSRTKTYLGTCALGGEWMDTGWNQGLCLDREGNLALHVIYTRFSTEQRKLWKTAPDFSYEDIEQQPYYLGFPIRYPDTAYAVFYVRNAAKMR